jgi:hypothetical protein
MKLKDSKESKMQKLRRPTKVNIMGTTYTIRYCKKPSDVDIHKYNSYWGQIDFWTRTIRIYDNGRQDADLWKTIIHEVLHGIAQAYNISQLCGERNHSALDTLASAIADTFMRNNWLAVKRKDA